MRHAQENLENLYYDIQESQEESEEDEIKKVSWTIGEVAIEINKNTSAIRFWESQFYWLKPKRTLRNNRKYKELDRYRLRIINNLINHGFTVQGIKALKEHNILEQTESYLTKIKKEYQDNL